MRITMYPPPPRLPANGNVTASANPVATAASTALPPARMISSPAALASALLLATIAVLAKVPSAPGLNRHGVGKLAGRTGCAQSGGAVPARTVELRPSTTPRLHASAIDDAS